MVEVVWLEWDGHDAFDLSYHVYREDGLQEEFLGHALAARPSHMAD